MNRTGRNILSLNSLLREEPKLDHENARRHGRVRVQEIRCSVGTVIDLSRSGVRVVARRKHGFVPDLKLTLTIDAFDQSVRVPGRVAWINKHGLFKCELGIEFGELDADQAAIMCSIARTAASNSHVGLYKASRAS